VSSIVDRRKFQVSMIGSHLIKLCLFEILKFDYSCSRFGMFLFSQEFFDSFESFKIWYLKIRFNQIFQSCCAFLKILVKTCFFFLLISYWCKNLKINSDVCYHLIPSQILTAISRWITDSCLSLNLIISTRNFRKLFKNVSVLRGFLDSLKII